MFLLCINLAYEDLAIARIPVVREKGSYGSVTAKFTSASLTATPQVDYIVRDGEVIFYDGMNRTTINVTIINDQTREFDEKFTLTLTSAAGEKTLVVMMMMMMMITIMILM